MAVVVAESQFAAVLEDHAGLRVAAMDHLPDADVVVVAEPTEAITDGAVVTAEDTTAIALTAQVLTAVARAGREPHEGRVLIVGADAMPALCPLLMAAGIGDITTWHRDDAVDFPLRRVAGEVDVVIDLLGACHTEDITVLVPDLDRDPLLALPGLVRALAATPGARLTDAVRHACARAMASATPPDRPLPRHPTPDLTSRVSDAAREALGTTAG